MRRTRLTGVVTYSCMPSGNSMTTTEPFRGARTSRPETARDPRPSLRRTTCTTLTLAMGGQARTQFPARPPIFVSRWSQFLAGLPGSRFTPRVASLTPWDRVAATNPLYRGPLLPGAGLASQETGSKRHPFETQGATTPGYCRLAKYARKTSRARSGPLIRQTGVLMTSAETATSGLSAGAKPTNHV